MSAGIHRQTVDEILRTIQQADREVLDAVAAAGPAVARFVTAVEETFIAGGRLIYLGAGTSGRLGVLDASEIPPTFQLPPGRIIGIIAGGDGALRVSSEGKEDDPRGAVEALSALGLSRMDTVLGIAAGGTTPYVLGALAFAKSIANPPLTGMLSCAPISTPPPLRSSDRGGDGAGGGDGLDAHESGDGDEADSESDFDNVDDSIRAGV